MALHRLTAITIGVPDVETNAAYYEEFGLTRVTSAKAQNGSGGSSQALFRTADGGEQLKLARAPRRRLLDLGIGADDEDDLGRIAHQLQRLSIAHERVGETLVAHDPGTDVRVTVTITPRMTQAPSKEAARNSPGNARRTNARADALLRETPVRPRKLGHVVLGTTDLERSERFFIEGIGFKVSDTISGLASFLRCSTDHHNLLVQFAPVPLLHHTSWQVDDVDEVGRGAQAILSKDPSRHVWGLGRHHIGSNFFWYLKDPAGNFTEYYADLDCILEDQLWEPGVWDASKALFNWGPPVPPSFLSPDDLAELMTGSHA